jgi:hypothetical protein
MYVYFFMSYSAVLSAATMKFLADNYAPRTSSIKSGASSPSKKFLHASKKALLLNSIKKSSASTSPTTKLNRQSSFDLLSSSYNEREMDLVVKSAIVGKLFNINVPLVNIYIYIYMYYTYVLLYIYIHTKQTIFHIISYVQHNFINL